MLTGIFAGITWALETVILGIALSMTPFVETAGAMILAPFISTFLHDSFSSLYMWLFIFLKGKIREILKILKSKKVLRVVLASAIGGPVGMTGYVLCVNYMGASVGAIASAVYPAIGSALAYFFLKEKIKWYQWIFLVITLLGVFFISYSPQLDIKNFWLGLIGALMCAFGWGIEGVILSDCLKKLGIKSEYALLIRQTTSALVYAFMILPVLGGWGQTVSLFANGNISVLAIVALAAFFATVSYLLYYKTIAKKGVSKAMSLNITYTAWAVFFSLLFFKDYSLLNVTTIGCGLVIVVCGILASADLKALFSRD